jgi:asparagine N-glycosylation enzyme membrane subunit Stt3
VWSEALSDPDANGVGASHAVENASEKATTLPTQAGKDNPEFSYSARYDSRPPTPGSRAKLALLAFTIALALRLLNAPFIFGSGKPRIAPVDELYHWKRITFSAMHFPHMLELDRDRGVGGAFCPWPPLYDLAAGGAARLLGATDADSVLARIVWFPPLLFALFVGLAVFVLASVAGEAAAIVCGIALAASPFLVTTSWIGSIDHHFLEPVLTFAILGATCNAMRLRDRRQQIGAGILLGLAIIAAMFVQTALLVAAALAFVVLFFWSDGVAAVCGFGMAALAVALYRLTRAPGFPDSQWFLGWTHAALFAGAAVACGVRNVGRTDVGRTLQSDNSRRFENKKQSDWRVRPTFFALLAGATVFLIIPSALPSLLTGAHFFGGDRWLRTIQEFQPLWRARGDDLLSDLAGLSGGAILVWMLLVHALRSRDRARLAVALFAIVYLGLTITSRRFWIVAIPLLALAGAVYVPLIARKRLAILAALLIALPPPLQLAGWLMTPMTPVPPNQQRWLRAAAFLKALPAGRVLAPWSLGHVIDVEGRHPVVIDNFGTMPDAPTFERAEQAFLSRNEVTLARYCDTNSIRYLILDTPISGVASANAILGTDQRVESTFWWRVYHGETPKRFQLLWSEPGLRIYRR